MSLRARLIHLGAGLIAILAAAACRGAEARLTPLAITVAARDLAPGEPLRVEACAPEALVSGGGTFLGRAVDLSPADPRDAAPRCLRGWAVIDLAQPPGIAVIELHARTARGALAAGTHAIRVAAREFPAEAVTVEPDYAQPPPAVAARIARERQRLDALYATRTPGPPLPRPFVRPVPGKATSVFGTRRTFNGVPRDPHSGLDLRAAAGTPVRAAGPGRVVLADELYYAGRTAIVDHGDGLFTIYAHLEALHVRAGQTVEAGASIGRSGATGRVSGPHLHWGARVGAVPFDPQALLDPGLFASPR